MARYKVGDKVRNIRIRRDFQRWDNTRILQVDWFTIIAEPPEAVVPRHGRDYTGVMFRLGFKVPMWVEQWK